VIVQDKDTFKVLCSINDKLSRQQPASSPAHSSANSGQNNVETSLQAIGISGDVPQRFANSNANRVELWICNVSSADLFLAPFGGDVNRNQFSVIIPPKNTLVMNAYNYALMYKNDIYGFWEQNAPVSSTTMITEFFRLT
jgi:hypothetical protein